MSLPSHQLTLVSHHLCPFVQRAVIALKEQGIAFTRKDIDLANKPDWFLKLSPLGLVPVLLVDDEHVVFESAVIAEFCNDIGGGLLLSQDPVEKAKQRTWVEFSASTLGNIGKLYNAKDEAEFDAAVAALQQKWQRLETVLPAQGLFCGEHFSLVDCALAPALRYFDVLDKLGDWPFIAKGSKLAAYRERLLARYSVREAVGPDYIKQMIGYIAEKDSYMAERARAYLA